MFGANIALTVTVVWLTVFMGRLDGSDVCNGETGKIPHPDSCAMYYDCSDPSTLGKTWDPYQRECDYKMIESGFDYLHELGHQECVTRHPSCEGLEDGMQPFVGMEIIPYQYAICRGERVESFGTCPWENDEYQIFDSILKECISPTSQVV